MRRRTKDADEVLDYTEDWSSWLGADTIQTSTWTIPAGLTQDSETETASTTTVWLSGGTNHSNYTCQNDIVTVGGRTAKRSFILSVIRK